MPSRQISPPSPPLLSHAPPLIPHAPPLSGGASISAAFSLLLLLTLCFRKLSRKQTVPSPSDASDHHQRRLHRFSYSSLRRATNHFSPSLRLGQGGFGSVFRGLLPTPVAVKVMDSGSLQGESEFHNELFFASKIESKFIVGVLGYSSDRKRRRMMIVYELMGNGSLQDCLFHRKSSELREWGKRFGIGLGIAKGLEYLHCYCDPPIIHGDIKPSNVLLDDGFNPKISDFGLARLREEVSVEIEGKNEEKGCVVDGVMEQSPESVLRVEMSPETLSGVELSPEGRVVSPRAGLEMVSPSEGVDKSSVSEANFDGFSVESGREGGNGGGKKGKKKKKSIAGKDWWWKQDSGGGQSGPVKDYVMEWLGNEIRKERPNCEFAGTSSNAGTVSKSEKKKKPRRRLEWWVSMDDEKKKKEKRRPAREWWKEEYCEELAREKKKKRKQLKGYMSDDHYSGNWWPRDETHGDRRKRSRSRGSIGSMDWWLEGVSGELWRRRTSHDSVSGDVPKSGGMSSTPSMRGTVCYIAPEYGGGGDLSEKCDVYSYGVLLLVLIAGRRPLQVTGSPMSEFQRANLLSWTRHLARRGKLLELVDQSIQSYDKEQALLCIKVALLCLQKSPISRPSMKEVVKYLSGESEPPQLPLEFSPSPASRVSLKSQRKARNMAL